MSGAPMQPLLPEPAAQRGGLGGGAVVAIDQGWTDGPTPGVDEHHRGALPGEPDGVDPSPGPQLANEGRESS